MNVERILAYVGAATLGAGACLLFVMSSESQADPFDNPGVIDRTIPYEGVLEIDGTEVMSGTHTFDFALFDGPESDMDAVQLWPATEWASEDLDVRAGRFAAQLGATDGPAPMGGYEALPPEVFEAVDLYLAIQVDGALLSSRQRINTVPWAVRSAHALHAEQATGPLEQRLQELEQRLDAVVPVGAILPYGGTDAPAGYLLCNGASVLRADYPELDAAIGNAFGSPDGTHFNLPDLNGRFLRGVAHGSGAAPDRGVRPVCASGGNSGDQVGSCQSDGFTSHNHVQQGVNSPLAGGTYTVQGSTASGILASSVTTQGRGGAETRPTNVYTNFIIRAVPNATP